MTTRKRVRDFEDSESGEDDHKPTKIVKVGVVDLTKWQVEDLPGANVSYIPEFVDQLTAQSWFTDLDNLSSWYHPTLKVYGKNVTQSRSITAFALSTHITAKYSGHLVTMHYPPDIPPIISTIWNAVSERLGLKFNHIMLNRYKNGEQYIGKHRDTKENGIIASLSLGAERTFVMSPNKGVDGKVRKWTLESGSLLVMQGRTQDNWKHEIPQERRVQSSRISVTFRQLPE